MDDKRLNFQWQTKPLFAEVNADGIRRILAILLDNAMKYTQTGGGVQITVDEMQSHVEFAVIDTGSGIPVSELPRIFERFYRVDESRDRQTGGFGLGLSIASQIAQAHGGAIVATSTLGSGSTFKLTLPKKRQD